MSLLPTRKKKTQALLLPMKPGRQTNIVIPQFSRATYTKGTVRKQSGRAEQIFEALLKHNYSILAN